jgi:hypothetical protein
MIHGRFRNDIKPKDMTFESCYYSGSMIGGAKELRPVIHLKGGKVITDIGVGYQTYTTYAYEKNRFRAGETVAECLERHGVSIDAVEIEKIVVYSIDTTGEKEIHEEFSWNPETGWKAENYIEID